MILFYVKSEYDPNKKYAVRLTPHGYRCGCPYFIFNERRIKECKHIKKIKRLSEASVRAH